MNYSANSWQMKSLASCPRSMWYLTVCLLCTPGSVCTINTTAEVTTRPQEIWTSYSLRRRPQSPSLARVNTLWRVERISLFVVHMWFLWSCVTSPCTEDTPCCGVGSLSLSTSSSKSIMLLDQPQITAAQLQPLDSPSSSSTVLLIWSTSLTKLSCNEYVNLHISEFLTAINYIIITYFLFRTMPLILYKNSLHQLCDSRRADSHLQPLILTILSCCENLSEELNLGSSKLCQAWELIWGVALVVWLTAQRDTWLTWLMSETETSMPKTFKDGKCPLS